MLVRAEILESVGKLTPAEGGFRMEAADNCM